MYADGSIETTYASGRVRVKNADGKLIMDEQKQKPAILGDSKNTNWDENTPVPATM